MHTAASRHEGTSQFIHLFWEPVESDSRAAGRNETEGAGDSAGTAGPDFFEVRGGVNYLVTEVGKRPRLVSRLPKKTDRFFVIQTVHHEEEMRLLLLCPGKQHIWVNGQLAPSLVLLKEKDEVSFNMYSGYIMHVACFNEPYVGPPPEEEVGVKCKLCTAEFDSSTRVYLCPFCRKPLHLEGEETPESERLQCAELSSTCPTCQKPILKEKGYRFLPEFCCNREVRGGV